MTISYLIRFPDYYDDYSSEIAAKGYFADVVIQFGDIEIRPTIYDPVRLAQECADALASGAAYFSVSTLIVVPTITRTNIMTAIESLSSSEFADLLSA